MLKNVTLSRKKILEPVYALVDKNGVYYGLINVLGEWEFVTTRLKREASAYEWNELCKAMDILKLKNIHVEPIESKRNFRGY